MGTKYDLNHSDTANFNYQAGTKLESCVTDLTNIVTRSNLRKTVNYNSGALAVGTSTEKIQIAAAIRYSIDGAVYKKAATDNIAMTAAASQAASTYCLYLVSINATGTVATTKGTAGTADSALATPACPANSCPIGMVHVALAASGAGVPFTAGTTALDASGVTDVYINLVGVDAGSLQSDLSVTMTTPS